MVPAKTRRKPLPKDRLQQARRQRGDEWETAFVAGLNRQANVWAVLLPKSWAGQPFDVIAMATGRAIAFQCKRIARVNVPYSCFTANEKEHLTRFEEAGGRASVAVYRDSDGRGVLIPWHCIRDDVLSGIRGSARLEGYPCVFPAAGEGGFPCR